MSIISMSLICLGSFCIGLLMIIAGFFLYTHSTSTTQALPRRLLQGLAVICVLASAGFLEYSNYLMFTELN